jgi:cytochrome c oxidase subunit II
MLEGLPINVSTFGGDIDGIIRLIFWITGFFLILAEAFLLFCILRFRRRDGVRAAWLPAETLVSNLFVLVPVAVVLVCDLYIESKASPVWTHVKEDIPKGDMTVRVTARQFMWLFTYPGPDGVLGTDDDIVVPNEMHVPRDRTIRLQLESTDVLHSFFVAAFRLKQDVVPGRSIPAWFNATQDGTFEIACSQICGSSHGVMGGKVVVQSPEAYEAWIATKTALLMPAGSTLTGVQ